MRLATKQVNPATGQVLMVDPVVPAEEEKYYGEIWPTQAHTMIGTPRLENIQYCVETALADKVPGDLIETGVWRGGASIFMRGILKAHGGTDRTVWVADSFAGLPPTNPALYPKESHVEFHRFEQLAISLEEMRANFDRYDLLDAQVKFLKGWFCDTLPTAPIEPLAVMRLDGDLYESTMDALKSLYPKLTAGGFVLIDDYNAIRACNEAVADYRQSAGISDEIMMIPHIGAYWRKSR